MEIKAIKGYNYNITSNGKILNKITSEKRKTTTNNVGYESIMLYRNGKAKSFLVHRLVAQAFIPNPLDKPQVNHIDENKLNNNIENLEWVTAKENMNHLDIYKRRSKPIQNINKYSKKPTTIRTFKRYCSKNSFDFNLFVLVFSGIRVDNKKKYYFCYYV